MAGHSSIDLEDVKSIIHFYYYEQNHPILQVQEYWNTHHNLQVNSRTLQQYLAKWEFIKYTESIASTIPPTLEAQAMYWFYYHILSNKKILVILHDKGYIHLTIHQLQHLHILVGMSRRYILNNFLTNDM